MSREMNLPGLIESGTVHRQHKHAVKTIEKFPFTVIYYGKAFDNETLPPKPMFRSLKTWPDFKDVQVLLKA